MSAQCPQLFPCTAPCQRRRCRAQGLGELGNDGEVGAYLAAFRALAASHDAGCRAACARALPAVALAATPRR